MMELYIRIVDGKPFEHPIFGDNFREAFPNVDVNNLPPEFARFERITCPYLATTFQVDEVSYQWVGDVVKDVWSVRDMTAEEAAVKQAKLDELAAQAAQDQNLYVESLNQISGTMPNVIG